MHCNIQEAFQDIHLELGSILSLPGAKLFECFYMGTGYPSPCQPETYPTPVSSRFGGKCYVKKTGGPWTPVPAETRFDKSQLHHLEKTESKRACIVHVQEVRTVYRCAVCKRSMRVEPCFPPIPHLIMKSFTTSRWLLLLVFLLNFQCKIA